MYDFTARQFAEPYPVNCCLNTLGTFDPVLGLVGRGIFPQKSTYISRKLADLVAWLVVERQGLAAVSTGQSLGDAQKAHAERRLLFPSDTSSGPKMLSHLKLTSRPFKQA